MLIVNEYVHALKQQQEVSYFSGQQPQSQPIRNQLHHSQQPIALQPVGIVPPIDPQPQVSLVAAFPRNFPQQQDYTGSEVQTIENLYYGGHPVSIGIVPAALQPPPPYDVAVNNQGQVKRRIMEDLAATTIEQVQRAVNLASLICKCFNNTVIVLESE